MTVLIAKCNEEFFTRIDSKLKFVESTVNTSTFEVSKKEFEAIKRIIHDRGLNPFAIMSW